MLSNKPKQIDTPQSERFLAAFLPPATSPQLSRVLYYCPSSSSSLVHIFSFPPEVSMSGGGGQVFAMLAKLNPISTS